MIPPVLRPSPALIGRLADSSKNNMSDWNKYTLNFARQFAVGSDRVLDYGGRSMNMPLNGFIKFATFYTVRDQIISPQVEAILELDRLHQQPHLTEAQRQNLPIQENILASDFDMLKTRLMDRSYVGKGLNFHTIPKNLQLDGRLVEKFVDGRYVYEREPISPLDPFIDHLYYRLDFNHYLRRVLQGYHNLNKRLPFFPDASYEKTAQVVGQIKEGRKHLSDLQMSPFMSDARWFLLDLGNGRYRYKNPPPPVMPPGEPLPPQPPVRIHHSDIQRTFDRYLNPQWSDMPVEQRFISHVIDQFIEGSSAAIPDDAEGSVRKPGKDDPLTRKIKKHFKQRLIEETPASTPLAERLEHLFTVLQSEYADIKTPDAEAQRFTFDRNNKLGLKNQPVADVAQQLAQRLEAISDVFHQGRERASNISSHNEMKVLGKSLVTRFDQAWLELMADLPAQGKGAEALRKIVASGSDSPLWRQFQDGLKSDTNVRSLGNVLSNSKLPDLLLGVVPSVFLSGVVWSWLDNKIVQPYQRDIVRRKGDAQGATPALILGLGAGWLTFFKTMNMDSVRMLLGNNDASLFRLSGIGGLLVGALATVASVRGIYALRPDLGPEGQPVKQGWRDNLNRACKEFFHVDWASLRSGLKTPPSKKPTQPDPTANNPNKPVAGSNRPVASASGPAKMLDLSNPRPELKGYPVTAGSPIASSPA